MFLFYFIFLFNIAAPMHCFYFMLTSRIHASLPKYKIKNLVEHSFFHCLTVLLLCARDTCLPVQKSVLTINGQPQSFRVALLYFNDNASHYAPSPLSSIIQWIRHIQLCWLALSTFHFKVWHIAVFFILFHSAHSVTNISCSIIKWHRLWFCSEKYHI